jgi:putative acetyltransferase
MNSGRSIVTADLGDPKVRAILLHHAETARAQTARGSAHALGLEGLQRPDITVWALWEGGEVLGVGALKVLGPGHGELKAMHTSEAARRKGIGTAVLLHILAAASQRGLSRVSLETGSWPYFAPARAFYASHGFAECPPFGDYKADANSVFMTLELPGAAPAGRPGA